MCISNVEMNKKKNWAWLLNKIYPRLLQYLGSVNGNIVSWLFNMACV